MRGCRNKPAIPDNIILKCRTYPLLFRILVLQPVPYMKETRIGDLEETMLLLVGILGGEAYAYRIADEFEQQTGRSISIGATHSTLDRLESKGFLSSKMGASTAERGGRRKRIFTITALGKRVLKESRDFKMALWQQYPGFSANVQIA